MKFRSGVCLASFATVRFGSEADVRFEQASRRIGRPIPKHQAGKTHGCLKPPRVGEEVGCARADWKGVLDDGEGYRRSVLLGRSADCSVRRGIEAGSDPNRPKNLDRGGMLRRSKSAIRLLDWQMGRGQHEGQYTSRFEPN